MASGRLVAGDTWLTEADAQSLVRINDLRRGFCQRVSGGVKLAQHCGIVRLPTCVLEVLPKVGMSDAREPEEIARARSALLTMLHDARRVIVTNVGAVPQKAVRAPLLDVFVEAFLLSAVEQARRGLLSRYVGHVDDLPVVKGRFNVHGQVKRNLGRPHVLHCEFDEFTGDNSYNRAIRAALDACKGWAVRPATQRLWFETQTRFAGVSAQSMSASDVAKLPRDRTTRRYDQVLTWCEWLLSLTSPALSTGMARAPGLLFDMNKLFEAYVSGMVERESGDNFVVHRQGPARALSTQGAVDAFILRPDITVWETDSDGGAGDIHCVLDAKWKRLDPHDVQWGVDQADIYQLLAYAVRYRCTTLELVYPQPSTELGASEALPRFEIAESGLGTIKIQVKTVPLWTGYE
ncbi:MAG: restriction endonuclease [Ideonella sp.]|nr:restriction endonuclease [Ideonella sp.]